MMRNGLLIAALVATTGCATCHGVTKLRLGNVTGAILDLDTAITGLLRYLGSGH